MRPPSRDFNLPHVQPAECGDASAVRLDDYERIQRIFRDIAFDLSVHAHELYADAVAGLERRGIPMLGDRAPWNRQGEQQYR
jgi:hypothetical protein